MADDGESIFAKAGFDIPKGKAAAAEASSAGSSSPSIFEAAGFSLPDKTKPAAVEAPSWKDAEALENLAATGAINSPSAPAKPGRGVWQAIKDYPAHLLHGLVDTVEAPGNILAATKPSTSESLLPSALGLAGLATGGEFPKAGVVTAAAKLGPSGQAVNALVNAVGPENALSAVTRMRENPRLTLADVSDPVRTMTQGLIDPAQPGVQNFVAQRVKERSASLPSAVNTAYTEAMGPAPDVVRMVEGLKQRATDAGHDIIQPAIKNAKPVDVTPVVAAIDREIAADPVGKATLRALKAGEEPTLPLSDYQRRLFQLRQDLRGSWQDRDQMFLDAGGEQGAHKIQTDLRAEAQSLLTSASGAERSLGGRLMGMRGKLVDQIDAASGDIPLASGSARVYVTGDGAVTTNPKNAAKYIDVPQGKEGLKVLADPDQVAKLAQPLTGAYKAGLSKYRDAKQIHEAFDAGFDTLKNRAGVKGLEDRPEALREWINDATPEEVVARRIGTRADIDQKVRSAKNQSLAGESITRIEYNQEKLRTLFGDKEANRLIRVMKDAQDEAATNAKLLAGSKTAETLAGQRALEVRKVGGGNPWQYVAPVAAEMLGQGAGFPGAGLVASLAGKGIHMTGQKLGQMRDVARNLEFAKNALASGPAREETINRLLSHPKVVRELKKSSNALAAP